MSSSPQTLGASPVLVKAMAANKSHRSEGALKKAVMKLLEENYGSSSAADLAPSVEEFSALGDSMTTATVSETSIPGLETYSGFLVGIGVRLGATLQGEGPTFKWSSPNSFFSAPTSPSLAYERSNVLYNVAVAHTIAGERAAGSGSAEGVKEAAKHLQISAGIFSYLRDGGDDDARNLDSSLDLGALSPDFSADRLTACEEACLGQAQMCFLHVATSKGMSAGVTSRIAVQATMFLANSRRHALFADDKNILYSQSAARLYATWSHSKGLLEAKKMGEAIGFLKDSLVALEECKKTNKKLYKLQFEGGKAAVEAALSRAEFINKTVYRAEVPAVCSLTSIPPRAMVRATTYSMTPLSPDPFGSLMPLATHAVASAYSERKDQLWRRVEEECGEAESLCKASLQSMDLPQALDVFFAPSSSDLPPQVAEMANKVRAGGGMDALDLLVKRRFEASDGAHEALEIAKSTLMAEHEEDERCRGKYGAEKWADIPPSASSSAELRSSGESIENAIQVANNADAVIDERLAKHRMGIERLNAPRAELVASMPRTSVSELKRSHPDLYAVVKDLKRKLVALDELMVARRGYLEVLKGELRNDNPTTRLLGISTTDTVTLDAMLKDHDSAVEKVRGGLKSQGLLLKEISGLHGQLDLSVVAERQAAIKELSAAHTTFQDLLNHLKEGVTWYQAFKGSVEEWKCSCEDYATERKIVMLSKVDELVEEQRAALVLAEVEAQPSPFAPTSAGASPMNPYYQGHHGQQNTAPNAASVPVASHITPTAATAAAAAAFMAPGFVVPQAGGAPAGTVLANGPPPSYSQYSHSAPAFAPRAPPVGYVPGGMLDHSHPAHPSNMRRAPPKATPAAAKPPASGKSLADQMKNFGV